MRRPEEKAGENEDGEDSREESDTEDPEKEAGEDEEGEETTQSSTHDLEATFEAVQRGGAIESGSTTGSESDASDDEDTGEGTHGQTQSTPSDCTLSPRSTTSTSTME